MDLVKTLYLTDRDLPACSAQLYEILVAGNGRFIRARRDLLEAIVPLSKQGIKGLAEIEPFIKLAVPKVPAALLQEILALSREAAPNEILFYLLFREGEWHLEIPSQRQEVGRVTTLDSPFVSGANEALIELHSHHELAAFFSATDDADESGFRLYGVLGTIFSAPTLRLRVGIYHQVFWDIPAHWVFDMPCDIYS